MIEFQNDQTLKKKNDCHNSVQNKNNCNEISIKTTFSFSFISQLKFSNGTQTIRHLAHFKEGSANIFCTALPFNIVF